MRITHSSHRSVMFCCDCLSPVRILHFPEISKAGTAELHASDSRWMGLPALIFSKHAGLYGWHLCRRESNKPLVKIGKVCRYTELYGWYFRVGFYVPGASSSRWTTISCWCAGKNAGGLGWSVLSGLVESYQGHLSLCSLEEQMLLYRCHFMLLD